MRCVLFLVGLVAFTGCPPQTIEKLPPSGRFYFPTGIVHVDAPVSADGGLGDGILYVASSNFDKRYDFGTVMAVDLSTIGLPPFGAPVGFSDAGFQGPVQLTDLKLGAEATVLIASFAGEMAKLPSLDAGAVRLYLPTRSEEHRLYALDAPLPAFGAPPQINCFAPTLESDSKPATESKVGRDCTPTGMSLVAFEKSESGIPRAPAPIGVSVPKGGREVWVTSLQQADTPRGSSFNPRAYVVHLNGDNPQVTESSFVNLGPGATNSIVVGARYAYATGRIYASTLPANLVRAVDTTTFLAFNTFLENTFSVFEGRGIALSSKEDRLYLLGRSPDTLVVVSVGVTGTDNPTPSLRVERLVPLPEGPSLLTPIARSNRSDLVMITCSTAGVVVFYDDEVGNLTAQIAGVGLQPYAIAVDDRPSGGARAYITNFTDGRVAVIDVPDLLRPASAKIVAFLGGNQLCITRGLNDQTSCPAP